MLRVNEAAPGYCQQMFKDKLDFNDPLLIVLAIIQLDENNRQYNVRLDDDSVKYIVKTCNGYIENKYSPEQIVNGTLNCKRVVELQVYHQQKT